MTQIYGLAGFNLGFSLRTSAYGTTTQSTFQVTRTGFYLVNGCGPGGGGAGGHTAAGGGGGGGGSGGEWCYLFPVFLTAGVTYYYQIGGGQAGGANGVAGTGASTNDTWIKLDGFASNRYVLRLGSGRGGSIGTATNGGAGANGGALSGGATGTGNGAQGGIAPLSNDRGRICMGIKDSGGGGGAGGGPSSSGGVGGDNAGMGGQVGGGAPNGTDGAGGGAGNSFPTWLQPSQTDFRGVGGAGTANGEDSTTALGNGGGGGGCRGAGGRGGDGFMDIFEPAGV